MQRYVHRRCQTSSFATRLQRRPLTSFMVSPSPSSTTSAPSPTKPSAASTTEATRPPRRLRRNDVFQTKDGRSLRMVLNEEETRLQELLLNVCQHHALSTEVRFVGGWVRDKLLGLPSDDIDIALSNMQGADFAEKCQSYLQTVHPEQGRASIHEIKTNPDKSKHLATATMKLLRYTCDIVNLRSETYSENSRIPQIDFGTPREDAQRRDMTANALFYNIHTQDVEDWTEQGLDDLAEGLVRTPIDPLQTFLDDPLRMLRVIRFAARFGFRLHPEVASGLKVAHARSALGNPEKISRERIGVEIAKMFSSKDPLGAVEQLEKASLLSTVFQLPEEHACWERCSERVARIIRLCAHTEEDDAIYHVAKGTDTLRWLVTAAILAPLGNEQTTDKKKPISKVKDIVLQSLKWSVLEADAVAQLVQQADLLQQQQQKDGNLFDNVLGNRVTLGLWVRSCRSLWPSIAALAAVQHADSETEAQPLLDRFCDKVKSLGLEKAYDIKPLLNGKEVIQLGARAGPALGNTLDTLIRFQLEQPHATKEDATHFIQSRLKT